VVNRLKTSVGETGFEEAVLFARFAGCRADAQIQPPARLKASGSKLLIDVGARLAETLSKKSPVGSSVRTSTVGLSMAGSLLKRPVLCTGLDVFQTGDWRSIKLNGTAFCLRTG
jgi:hypothetical protein